jgi:PAS domain S-box-containing protein
LLEAYEKLLIQSEKLMIQSDELQVINNELNEKEKLFHTMANAIPQLAWIAHANGYIYWYNDRWYAYTGTTPEQMKGWGWKSVHDPDVLPKVLEQWNTSISTGQKFDMELPLRGSDGIFRPFLTRVLPFKNTDGQVVQWFGTNTDITELREKEVKLKETLDNLEKIVKERTAELETAYNSLKESEERYRNIVETANEGILIIDNEAKITFTNKRMIDMLGYFQREGIGRPIWDFLSEESKAIVKLNLKNRRLGIDDSYELKLTRKNGSELWAIVNAKSLFDKNGKFEGSMSMLTDITIRKEAEKALANFEIAREKEVHHRVKNNLQIVSSLLDLQAYKFKGRNDISDSEVVAAFKESQSRVISMALIHEELYKGGLETINFSEYVERLADNLLSTYSLGNTDISLNKDLEGDLLLDMDTAIPLGTIINELISNSFK